MKKKILALMLVLGITSTAQATKTYFTIDGEQISTGGIAGETVRIDLIADAPWYGCEIGGIVEASGINSDWQALDNDVIDVGGTISAPIAAPGVTIIYAGYQDNWSGNLAMGISAEATSDPIPAGNPTISFDYTVNPSWDGTTDFWIACLKAGETYYFDGGSMPVGASYSDLGAAGDVLIQGAHDIPEPTMIALFGLGGLFLRRRR